MSEPIPGAIISETPSESLSVMPTRGWESAAKQQSKVPDAFRYCFIDGVIKSEEDVKNFHDLGFTHGAGCYETILFRNGNPFLFQDHIKRFLDTCRSIGCHLPLDVSRLMQAVRSVVSRNNMDNCLIRCFATPGNYGLDEMPKVLTPSLIIECLPSKLPSVAELVEGINIATVSDDRWGRSDLKTTMLLPNLMAHRAALEDHCEEALFVTNEGNVTQCAFSNIFCFFNGELHTPPAGPHCNVVPGLIRHMVIEIAEDKGISVNVESPLSLWALSHSEEIFVTSTSQLILPVHSVDGKPCQTVCGSVTLEIMEELAGRLAAETGGEVPFSNIQEDMKNLQSAGIGEHSFEEEGL
ncbi:hypothetical protein GEMRC1_010367 [Eukaryota sp. GEM-RC1]